MRFVHPVVNGVIASDGRKRTSSISVSIYSRDTSGEDREDQHATTQPGTPTTIATVDFEDQVNPKRVHKKLRVSASYNTFKDVMDGMKPMPVAAAPPTLPYIPLSSAMELEKNNESDSNDTTALAALAAKVQAEYILPATSKLPAVLLVPVTHPNTLTPGTAQPTAPPKPRTTAPRPHTTGNFLPYMAFSPDFDPYNATTAADTPAPSTYKGKGKGRAKDLTIKTPASSTSLSAAFAEADEAEARLAHKRHTVLYEEIEADFSVGPVPVIASSSSSSYFPSSSSNPPKQPKPQCQQKQIKRKAVPTALAAPAPAPAPAPAAAVRTSKPLPALPSPSSPRRFTQVVKPETLAMNENGYPFLGEASKQKQKPKTQQQESDEKQFKTTTTTKKARAVANADADANANAPDAAHKSRRAAGVRAVERALAKLML